MPGQIISVPLQAHVCDGMPEPTNHVPGTIWQCDECSQQWVVVSGQGEDNMGYVAWRRLTEANRGGQDN